VDKKMPLFKKLKEKNEDKESSTEPNVKEDKRDSRRSFKIEKIQAITAKAKEVAGKRKWLAIILGLGIVIYFLVSGGGFSKMLPIIENVKGFFN
tara:strand:+ start:4211 stop:4492 length:282 start_codon:yes stop_codon:yes gene_type:complete